MVRTRFAPSPTGSLHLGNLRTALYAWAFSRKMNGKFILRIEDTDQMRVNKKSVDSIIHALSWLQLDIDEGPFYQMQRIDHYRKIANDMILQDKAYYCYMTEDELNDIRHKQIQNKEKPKYNELWRPEKNKILQNIPSNVHPVIRFKNPKITDSVIWKDEVKGIVQVSNKELDDFVIIRSDGTPTYNFCVVIDDIDMRITHVIRGDDHINNTPRQINIFYSLNENIPIYAHLPTILNENGSKISKRNGAVSLMDYAELGYLPQAMFNYLAKLGWSHDDEIFTRENFINWFDLKQLGKSSVRFDSKKLLWMNRYYIQQLDPVELSEKVKYFAEKIGFSIANGPDWIQTVSLFKDRSNTLLELAQNVSLFYKTIDYDLTQLKEYLNEENIPAIKNFIQYLKFSDGTKESISNIIKEILQKYEIKMNIFAISIRYAIFGTVHTPSLDIVIALLGVQETIFRLQNCLQMI